MALAAAPSMPGVVTRSTNQASITANKKRVRFVAKKNFKVNLVPHHRILRERDDSYDEKNFTTRLDEAANNAAQGDEILEARTRGLHLSALYSQHAETPAQEIAQEYVKMILEASIKKIMDSHRPTTNRTSTLSASTLELKASSIAGLLFNLVAECAVAYGEAKEKIFRRIVDQSTFLTANRYSATSLRALVSARTTKLTPPMPETLLKLQHAYEAALTICARLDKGIVYDDYFTNIIIPFSYTSVTTHFHLQEILRLLTPARKAVQVRMLLMFWCAIFM